MPKLTRDDILAAKARAEAATPGPGEEMTLLREVKAGRGFTHEPSQGGTPEWYTPPWVFERLGLRFALDPASPPNGPVPWVPAEVGIIGGLRVC